MTADWGASAWFVGGMALLLAGAWLLAAAVVAVGLWRTARRVDDIDLRERLDPYTDRSNVRVIRGRDGAA